MNFTAKWDVPAQKMFGAGVDRGMVYTPSGPAPWIGLVSVNVEGDDGVFTPRYLDGIPVTIASTPRDARGSIEAFTYPDELAACLGEALPDGSFGIIATGQPRQSFDMSYREMIGHSGTLKDEEYIIHLLYDVHLQDDGRTHNTLADTSDPDAFAWSFLTSSRPASGLRPTSYFKIDTRKTHPTRVRMIEDLLYGVDDTQPQMPPVDEIRELLEPFQVTYEWAGNPHVSESIEKMNGREVRRNYIINPSFELGTAGWNTYATSEWTRTTGFLGQMWQSAGGQGNAWVPYSDNGRAGDRIIQWRASGASANSYLILPSENYVPVTPGEWIAVGGLVAGEVGSNHAVDIVVQFRGEGSSVPGNPPDVWENAGFYSGRLVRKVAQVPEGADSVRIVLWARTANGSNLPENSRAWADAIALYKAPSEAEAWAQLSLGYFDGDTPSHPSWYPDGRWGD